MKTDYYIPGKIERWSKDWPLLEKLVNSEYGNILDSAFENLNPAILYDSITHGRGHIERTMLFGALICMNESIDPELAKDVVCCCALHDIGRVDDRYDEQHGENSAKRLIGLDLGKCFRHSAEACAAIHAHSMPDSRMFTVPGLYDVKNMDVFRTLAICLKDADNLDRVRIYDLDESFLRHESTKKMVPLAYFVLNEFNHVASVLCYGDSNTYGFNPVTCGRYPKHMRWPDVLQGILGDGYDVIAEGANGRTAVCYGDGDMVSSTESLENALFGNYPLDWIVFMLGTNDCAAIHRSKADDIASGMEKLVKHAREFILPLQGFEPKIIIIAPRSLDEKALKGNLAEFENEASLAESARLPGLYAELAEKLDCGYISLEDVLELSPVDGIHLQAFGGSKIAKKVAEIILGNP